MTDEIQDINTLRLVQLLSSLDEATMAFLGKHAHPVSGEVQVNLGMAQWNIEVISALETKCEGNLEEAEKVFLQQILSRLRLNYVDVAKSESEAQKETAEEEKPGEAAGSPDSEETGEGGEGEKEGEGKE